MTTPKIALISAVTTAIVPAEAALSSILPDADLWNILDDRLLTDADRQGGLNDRLRDRMIRLITHAVTEGADGILLTCSLYGPVAQQFPSDIPVLAPDESAFSAIVEAGYESVLVVASLERACDDSVERLRSALADAGSRTRVTGLAVPEAMKATKAGDHAGLLTALLDACLSQSAEADAVFLAQYSLAPISNELEEALGIPVLSGPESAALALEQLLSTRVTA
jgi:Asp/Glu/hydantoin racemase